MTSARKSVKVPQRALCMLSMLAKQARIPHADKLRKHENMNKISM